MAGGQSLTFQKLTLRKFPKVTEARNITEEKYWNKYKVMTVILKQAIFYALIVDFFMIPTYVLVQFLALFSVFPGCADFEGIVFCVPCSLFASSSSQLCRHVRSKGNRRRHTGELETNRSLKRQISKSRYYIRYIELLCAHTWSHA